MTAHARDNLALLVIMGLLVATNQPTYDALNVFGDSYCGVGNLFAADWQYASASALLHGPRA